MNNRQNSNPAIRPLIDDERGIHPLIAKLRRKLGLTYIVSNPFRVPVAQSANTEENEAARKRRK